MGTSGHFIFRVITPATHWMRDWVGFRYCGTFEKRKVPFLSRDSDHNPPVVPPLSQSRPRVPYMQCQATFVSLCIMLYHKHVWNTANMSDESWWRWSTGRLSAGVFKPELSYRNLALLFLSYIDYRKLKLFCVTHSLNITWSASTAEGVATAINTEGNAFSFLLISCTQYSLTWVFLPFVHVVF